MDNSNSDYEQTDSYDEEYEDSGKSTIKKKKKFKMMCFSCNREEYHSLKSKRRWLYSYILGMTFGMSIFIGPFSCACCGNSRLMCRNWASLRYWIRKRKSTLAK